MNKELIQTMLEAIMQYASSPETAVVQNVPDDAIHKEVDHTLVSDTVRKDILVTFKAVNDQNGDQQLVTGVVLVPNEIDAHGDVYNEESVRKAAHNFVMKGFYDTSPVGKLQHSKATKTFKFVESFIAPVDMTIAGEKIVKGTWLITTQILDKELWKSIKSGDFTGFSIGGTASFRDLENDE